MKKELVIATLIALSLAACGKTQEELAADAERAEAAKAAAQLKMEPVVPAAAPAAATEAAAPAAAAPAAADAAAPAAAPTAGPAPADKPKE